MNLEELKVKSLSDLIGQTLTAIVPTHDGQILLFGDSCVHQGSETGHEYNETYITENKDFDPIEHYSFFLYFGLITKQQAEDYGKMIDEKHKQRNRERELEQLARLKRQYPDQ